jgi:hypothetical protein
MTRPWIQVPNSRRRSLLVYSRLASRSFVVVVAVTVTVTVAVTVTVIVTVAIGFRRSILPMTRTRGVRAMLLASPFPGSSFGPSFVDTTFRIVIVAVAIVAIRLGMFDGRVFFDSFSFTFANFDLFLKVIGYLDFEVGGRRSRGGCDLVLSFRFELDFGILDFDLGRDLGLGIGYDLSGGHGGAS